MKRLVTGSLLAACWLALVFSQNFFLFWLVIVTVGAVGLHELFTISLKGHASGDINTASVIAVLPLLACFCARLDLTVAALVASLILSFVTTIFRYTKLPEPFLFANRLSLGALWISFFSAHLVLIMAQPDGHYWILLLTAITAFSDTGAYYAGSLFGRNKLCPHVSPGKTIEGFVGGMFGGVTAAIIVATIFMPQVSLLHIAGAALVLTPIGVVGDLAESIMKRSCGVKDSGTILPGHGGILDRADSVLLTAPVLYYLHLFISPL